jgi:hypothetical protein
MDGFVRSVAARRSDGSVRIESAALMGGTASVVIFGCSFKSGSATLIPKHDPMRDDTRAARFFGTGTVHNFPVRDIQVVGDVGEIGEGFVAHGIERAGALVANSSARVMLCNVIGLSN